MDISVESLFHLRPIFVMHMPLALQAFGLGQVAQGLKALFIPPFLPEEAIGFFLPYIILVTPKCWF